MATTADPQPANPQEASNRPTPAKGWGTDAPDQPLRPMDFERRALRANDVAIKITYAGICHSDLHTCRNDWHNSQYPVIPGHEIVGTVTAVGNEQIVRSVDCHCGGQVQGGTRGVSAIAGIPPNPIARDRGDHPGC